MATGITNNTPRGKRPGNFPELWKFDPELVALVLLGMLIALDLLALHTAASW